ncbi:MAG: four helix bundle protein [Candidatus Pacearchaeota archaeon]|jgi:four helix bundle protein|nr:four helix bundle protein [Candidatus Moranbacteria bacterium]
MDNRETGKIRSFTDLIAWQEGHRLVLMTYKLVKKYPKDELFALVTQIRRCVVSITSNIAEGFSRQSYKEKLQFYSIAQGSVTELQNQLLISKDVGYLNNDEFDEIAAQIIKVHKLVSGLIKKTKNILNS